MCQPSVCRAGEPNATDLRFRDASRQRSIPVRVFSPVTFNAYERNAAGESREKFPVIVFSHGLGGSPECCSYLGTAWASRGFFVVMLRHPGSDEDVWKGKVRVLHELQGAYRANWSGRTRALDIRFALDRLESLAARGDKLASQMNLRRVGVGGYDLGSLAALLLAGQLPPDGGPSLRDPRIGAVLAMSPPVNGTSKNFSEVYAPVAVPVFFVTGTEDDGVVGSTKANQRRIPFDSLGTADRYLVTMQGADHRVYGDRIFSVRARNDKPFQSLIVRASTCFWQAVLQENDTARNTLNGRGLAVMLGGMARLERRLAPEIMAPETIVSEIITVDSARDGVTEPPVFDEPEMELPVENNREIMFPITRAYRVVSEKYAATSP